MARRETCWRTAGRVETHIRACRPGRPCCKWRRAALAAKQAGSEKPLPPCDCPAYPFPHRPRSGLCGDPDAFAAKRYAFVPASCPAVTYAEAAAE